MNEKFQKVTAYYNTNTPKIWRLYIMTPEIYWPPIFLELRHWLFTIAGAWRKAGGHNRKVENFVREGGSYYKFWNFVREWDHDFEIDFGCLFMTVKKFYLRRLLNITYPRAIFFTKFSHGPRFYHDAFKVWWLFSSIKHAFCGCAQVFNIYFL